MNYGEQSDYWMNPSVVSSGRDDYQARLMDLTDRYMLEKYGLTQFMPGGQFAPENVMNTYQQAGGGFFQPQMMSAPSVGGAQGYGMAAMGLAGRGAALNTGFAGQSMGGMSPAARAAALAQVSGQGSASMGQAGVQGMMQGGNWMQQANANNQQAGLQAGLANQQDRMNLFGNSMGNLYNTGMFGASTLGSLITGAMQNRDQRRAQNRQATQQLVGNIFGQAAQIPFMLGSGGTSALV